MCPLLKTHGEEHVSAREIAVCYRPDVADVPWETGEYAFRAGRILRGLACGDQNPD